MYLRLETERRFQWPRVNIIHQLKLIFGRKWKENFLRKYPVILVMARKGKGNQLQSCSEARLSFLNAKPAKK